MSESKAPRLTIEQDEEARRRAAEDAASREPVGGDGAAAAPNAGADDSHEPGARRRGRGRFERVPGAVSAHAAREALADADESFSRYAVAHRNTVVCGLIALVLALLVIFLGFWSTLLIAVFVLVGVLIGQALDGDNGIINFFRRLFGGR